MNHNLPGNSAKTFCDKFHDIYFYGVYYHLRRKLALSRKKLSAVKGAEGVKAKTRQSKTKKSSIWTRVI